LRGLDGVKAEMSLLASCFNIARMISIIGVTILAFRRDRTEPLRLFARLPLRKSSFPDCAVSKVRFGFLCRNRYPVQYLGYRSTG
jgi:hypothetical protein